MKEYNKTQLNPEVTFERHVFHRDQFAHYLRWSHVLKRAKIGMRILDLGCGSGNLAEVLYRNRFKASIYLGIDIRKKCVQNARESFSNVPWIKFEVRDIVKDDLFTDFGSNWDIICCFEVLEHIGKQNASILLSNIKKLMSNNTVLLLSTPNYDEKVGAAKNHTINGEISEWKHDDLYDLLNKYFYIEVNYGTFASIKDYKDKLSEPQKKLFDKLSEYYDSNVLSIIFAPLFPKSSRNCLWVLKWKK